MSGKTVQEAFEDEVSEADKAKDQDQDEAQAPAEIEIGDCVSGTKPI